MKASVYKGIFWFFLCLVSSVLGDACIKILDDRVHLFQLSLLKCLFAAILCFPFAAKQLGSKSIMWKTHAIRGLLSALATCMWVYGLKKVDISVATVLGFSIPIFVIPLSCLFLKEKFSLIRSFATAIGFSCVGLVMWPAASLHTENIWMLGACFCYALITMFNKKLASQQTLAVMIFCPLLFSIIIFSPFALVQWQSVCLSDFSIIFLAAVFTNLLVLSITMTFRYLEASFISPFYFLEFPLSIFLGYFLFQEIVKPSTLLAGFIIVIINTLLVKYENLISMKDKSEKLRKEIKTPV